jgi:hypothetical protein
VGLNFGCRHDDNLKQPFAGEWLLDEHVAAYLERTSHIISPILAGEKNNRDMDERWLGFDLLADIIAVHTGHHDIKQDDIRPELQNLCHGLLGRVLRCDTVAGFGKEGLHDLGDFRLVVDYQYAGSGDFELMRH